MTSWAEESKVAKEKKRGVLPADTHHVNKKKPKVRGPWKVIGKLFGNADYIYHHCLTKELAQKMVRKHHYSDAMRIEYQGGRNE